MLNEYFDDININESESKGTLNKEILERINNTKDSIINALWVRSTNPVLNITFDQDPMVFKFNSFNGSSFKLSNINPVSENNTSTTTSGVFINTGNAWEGNYLDLKSTINLEKGSTIKLNLHSNKSVEIVVKLENSSGENSSTEDAKFHSGNGWEELNFSFSPTEKYNRLVVFIDGPGNTAGDFYIKSIIQSNSKIQIKK